MTFDYSLDFKNINFREHPELYRIGRGNRAFCWSSRIRVKSCLTGIQNSAGRPQIRQQDLPNVPGVQGTEGFCRHGYGAQVSADGLYPLAKICQSQVRAEVQGRIKRSPSARKRIRSRPNQRKYFMRSGKSQGKHLHGYQKVEPPIHPHAIIFHNQYFTKGVQMLKRSPK